MAILSYTSCQYYKSCPKFYEFKYTKKTQPQIRMNTRPFLEGAALHNTLEFSYGMKKPLDKDVTLAVFDRAWAKAVADQRKQGDLRFNRGETLVSLKAKTHGIVLNAIEYINILGIDKTEFYNEKEIGSYDKPFKLVEGLYVHGKADHVQILDDNFWVFDYKGSKDKTYLKPAQLILYVIALEKLLNKKAAGTAFLMFQLKQRLNCWPTDENKKRVLDEFIEVAHKIDDGLFDPNPSIELCEKCVFRNQCPSSAIKVGPQIFDLGSIEL